MLRFFTGKKLPHIISGFDKTVKALEELQERNELHIDYHGQTARQAQDARNALIEENAKAETIARNIRKIVGV